MQITIVHPTTNIAYTFTTQHSSVINNVPVVLVNDEPIYYSVTLEDNGDNELRELDQELQSEARRLFDPSHHAAPTPHYLDISAIMHAAYMQVPYRNAETRAKQAANRTVDTLVFLDDAL